MPTWSYNVSGPGQQSGAIPSTFGGQVAGDPNAGYGALNFQAIAPGPEQGYNDNLAYGYMGAARNILAGSLGARSELLKGYSAEYRHRAEGIAGAQGEYANRLSGETASQGLSPDIVRRMLMQGNAQTQAQIGSMRGDLESHKSSDLAELFKGTATELTALQRDQMSQILQAYLAKKSRDSAKKAGQLGFLGGGIGSLIGAFGSYYQGAGNTSDAESASAASG